VTTTYLSTVALDRIEAAQATFARHAVSSLNGRCLECLAEGPCRDRIQALRLLAAYGSLPRREPGATQPDLAGFGQHVWSELYDRLIRPDEIEDGLADPGPVWATAPVAIEHGIVPPVAVEYDVVPPVIVKPRRPMPGRHAKQPG
jgi:hypothetical protein